MPRPIRAITRAFFKLPAIGIMLTASALILAVMLAPVLGFKTRLALTVLILMVAVTAVTWFVIEVFRNARIKEWLSERVSQGGQLLVEIKDCSNRGHPPPTNQVNNWIAGIESYIQGEMERADYLRFHEAQPSSTTPFISHSMMQQYWLEYQRVFAHLEVLKEFIREISQR
ncbi:MAG TPA: hypothetical protein VGQ72_04790 [Pyrinomonadaceae bacterium]|jgi:hypothetical protein|nr:hypothetical protein [Pyrinomonadaceae bacterium]